MDSRFRRAHARHVCDVEVEIYLGASTGRLLDRGRILDVSLSGAFLLCTHELKAETNYRLNLPGASGKLEIPFLVAREGPRGTTKQPNARSYGLRFDLPSDKQIALHRFIDKLGREVSPEEERLDRSLRDYWSS